MEEGIRATEKLCTEKNENRGRMPDTDRRRLLRHVAPLSVGFLGGCTSLRTDLLGGAEQSDPEYLSHSGVTYSHPAVSLELSTETASIGDSLRVEITNDSIEDVVLGCDVPWAIQSEEDGKWNHVAWTRGRYLQACITMLSSGATINEQVPLSMERLTEASDVAVEKLEPGLYRFVLIGPKPYPVKDFELTI